MENNSGILLDRHSVDNLPDEIVITGSSKIADMI
jgi:hypothetical protein